MRIASKEIKDQAVRVRLASNAASSLRRGPKPGSKARSLPYNVWNEACARFVNLRDVKKRKFSHKAFLTSHHSGEHFTGTHSEVVQFGRKLAQYEKGVLENTTRFRKVDGAFPEAEKMIVQYINFRSSRYKFDKCGLSLTILQQRAEEYKEVVSQQSQELAEKYRDFKASNGWFERVFRRNNIVSVSVQGEAAKIDDVENDGTVYIPTRMEVFELFSAIIRRYNSDGDREDASKVAALKRELELKELEKRQRQVLITNFYETK